MSELRDSGHLKNFREIELFKTLNEEEWDYLCNHLTQRACAKTDEIFHADEPGEDCFILLKGRVKLCLSLEDGREISFEILGSGDLIGEGVLLDPPRYNCDAKAMERTELAVVPRRQLLQLMENNGQFSLHIARHMAGRLSDFRQRQEMLLHSVNVRFARLLLNLAKRYGSDDHGPSVRLNVKLTHQEMANLIGTARETLTLTVGKFRNEGVLAESGRSLVIVDMEELERRASAMAESNRKID